MLTARNQQIIGIGWIFLLKLLLLFSDRWVKLLQAIWPHQKAQAIVGCVHVIHQRMTFGWQHGIIKQIQRSILSGVWIISHTFAPCTLLISQYIEMLYTHLMFYQISSSLLWTLAGMAAKVSKAPVEVFSTTFADRVGTLDNSTISTVGRLKTWFVAIRWQELSWLASLPTYQLWFHLKVAGALWGLHIADAIAMPSHWYYGGWAAKTKDLWDDVLRPLFVSSSWCQDKRKFKLIMVRSLDMPGAETFWGEHCPNFAIIGANLGPARSNPKWNYGARSWRFPTQEDFNDAMLRCSMWCSMISHLRGRRTMNTIWWIVNIYIHHTVISRHIVFYV